MDCSPVPVDNSSARKRIAQPEKWRRNLLKVTRYSPKTLAVRPLCNHKKKFECRSLSMQDVKSFFESFYKFKDKRNQDAFILKHCTVKSVKRHRPKNSKYTPKSSQTTYFVYSATLKKRLLVCQTFFLNVLQIKKYRVQTIMKEYFETGTLLNEKRGGDRVSHKNMEKKRAVMSFIEKLHCEEPHYCRGNTKRLYLSAELSINKLYRLYNSQVESELKVKPSYFRNIFNRNYNLGFGSPRTDVCSVCLQFTEKMKTETRVNIRNDLIVMQRIHKLKAKAFFGFVKEEKPDLLTLSFDCEKNLSLPKTPDQSAYYSRQINLFNFTIVQGSSKSKLDSSNVFAYCWSENLFPKASNQISSAIYHRLQNTNLTGIKTVRLIADGCAGQNKNSTVLGMCAKWLSETPQVKSLELIFPIVGHSFIPPDRVFARIEKEIRKREIMANPEEYHEIIKNFATVIKLGDDCKVYHWKDAVGTNLKPVGRWHFQFKSCKRYELKRSKKEGNVLVKGMVHYKHDDCAFKSVNRPGVLSSSLNPQEILATNEVSVAKAIDINKLLTNHYGENWREIERLNFYVPLVSNSISGNEDTLEDSSEMICEPQETPTGFYV
ncbi:hypothetical protein PYW08_006831 [Mythimna loreyi]|uniref:Uncharacterized protein n=3 Tax=Mythimna loreyi TaxID=667449 RepID=A0ACC2QU17_9NEOP|nr:hypothetical protein PYW08_010903 [Mythimna loreyi]KAJ8725760.1 hypothetical protein PYW08_003943 [Mythimna loreyi]KAJ8736175.1 hypothetical protein PYW08_006831 [Mythimna loreyi]